MKHLYLPFFKNLLKITFSLDNVGHKDTPFVECCERFRRRKTEEIRSEYSSDVLAHATSSSLWEDKKYDASTLVKQATATTPTRATKILKTWKKPESI